MKWFLLIVFGASVLYVRLRGAVRLRPWRQLFDHSIALAALNTLLQLCSKAPRTPFAPLRAFPELAPLQQHWRIIRAEARQLMARKRRQGTVPSGDAHFDAFVSKGWKYFYLKWYDVVHDSAVSCARRAPRCCRRFRRSGSRPSPSCRRVDESTRTATLSPAGGAITWTAHTGRRSWVRQRRALRARRRVRSLPVLL